MKNLNILLFEFLVSACLSEGGDGDVAFVSPDYISAANKFEQWLSETNNTWWKRKDEVECIMFYHDQETICFSEKEDILSFITTLVKSVWPIWK